MIDNKVISVMSLNKSSAKSIVVKYVVPITLPFYFMTFTSSGLLHYTFLLILTELDGVTNKFTIK